MAADTDNIEPQTTRDQHHAGDPHVEGGGSDDPRGLRRLLVGAGLVAACGVCLLPALVAGSVLTGGAVWFGTAGAVVALAVVAAVAWWRR